MHGYLMFIGMSSYTPGWEEAHFINMNTTFAINVSKLHSPAFAFVNPVIEGDGLWGFTQIQLKPYSSETKNK